MAQNPNPDRNIDYMMQNWGTNRLITDYMPEKRQKPNNPPTDRYSRPCGGKNGFDDYVERWHE
jgi:hypothetical protein